MNHAKALRLAQDKGPATPSFDVAGKWRNKHGAVLDLTVDGSNLSGTLHETTHGFAHAGEGAAAVKGYVTGDLLAFMVLWARSGSITSWSGQILADDTGAVKLDLMWRLITELPQPEEPRFFWMSTFAGTDDFYRAQQG